MVAGVLPRAVTIPLSAIAIFMMFAVAHDASHYSISSALLPKFHGPKTCDPSALVKVTVLTTGLKPNIHVMLAL
jgi:hypothetical protein